MSVHFLVSDMKHNSEFSVEFSPFPNPMFVKIKVITLKALVKYADSSLHIRD